MFADDLLYKIEVDITSKIKKGCDITPEEYINQFKVIFPQIQGDDLKAWEYEIQGIFNIVKTHYDGLKKKKIMGKFKVGDKARVREDLEVGKTYGGVYFGDFMEAYKGKIGTITECSNNYYRIDKRVWQWSDEMLEPIQEEFTFQEVIARIKPNETYENINDKHKLQSISMNESGLLRMKYIEKTIGSEIFVFTDNMVYVGLYDKFRLKGTKPTTIYYIVRKPNSKRHYKFISDEELNINDFVICDTKFGEEYGQIISYKNEIMSDEEIKQYKKCWKA